MVLGVILTSIALVATTIGVWTHRTLWDTDRYVALVTPVAEDPAVQSAVADRLTAEAMVALDVHNRVSNAIESIPQLPDSATFLVGPITSATENVIRQQVQRFLASATFQRIWVQLNAIGHEKVVALLEGNYSQLPNVSVDGGEVRLNFISAIANILRVVLQGQLNGLGLNVTIPAIPPDLDASAAIDRLNTALGVQLPSDFGQVTIMTKQQLLSYQQTARTLNRLGGALLLVTLVLAGLTLLVANNRRRALMWLGLGGAAGLLVGAVFLRRVRVRILDRIAAPGAKAAAADVFNQVGSSLRRAGILVAIVALLIAFAAYLAGRPGWFVAALARTRAFTARTAGTSDLDRWVARHTTAIEVVAGAIALLALWITGIDWIPVAVILIFLALVWWGTRTARDHTARAAVAA
jgi:hypothetical protein